MSCYFLLNVVGNMLRHYAALRIYVANLLFSFECCSLRTPGSSEGYGEATTCYFLLNVVWVSNDIVVTASHVVNLAIFF